MRLPALAVLGLIRLYQLVVSPWFGPRCKYYPSCSAYGYQAVRTHGVIVGSLLAGWRLLRCNPFSNGGVDDVPARGEALWRRPAAGVLGGDHTGATAHARAHTDAADAAHTTNLPIEVR